MAKKFVAVWPKVRLYIDGKTKVIAKGDPVPAGLSDDTLANLVSFGAIVNVDALTAPADESDGGEDKPTTVKGILAAVGEDQALASEYLEAEKAKGDDARPSLLEKLEAIANPAPAGD